jgi:rubredoxin
MMELALRDSAPVQYQCMLCSFVYDQEQGCPEHGIAPGTAWEDIDEEWSCPDCGAGKEDFFLKDY